MLVTDGGKVIRTPVRGISVIGRNTQGVRLIDLEEGEKVVGVARAGREGRRRRRGPDTSRTGAARRRVRRRLRPGWW